MAQRIWQRVERGDSAKGHALVAGRGRRRWEAVELDDGRWKVEGPDGTEHYDDFEEVRAAVEPRLSRTKNPAAMLLNPVPALIAGTAVSGTLFGIRRAMATNPADPAQEAITAAAPVLNEPGMPRYRIYRSSPRLVTVRVPMGWQNRVRRRLRWVRLRHAGVVFLVEGTSV